MKYLLTIFLVLMLISARAQYAPQQGLAGSTAISASSSQFVAWATNCTLIRGYIDINDTSLGRASYGEEAFAYGIADNSVVSLGDSGIAIINMGGYLYDAPGPDFAVFENAFVNPDNDSQSYNELAFVEVSSDGLNYFRFPAQSATQTTVQIAGTGEYMYANKIHNLAGKYRVRYGTPFDLNELSGIAGLDISHITSIRLVDVIGDIGRHRSYDSGGRVINDPYPTPFITGGFDLDAVGYINYVGGTGIESNKTGTLSISPNPANHNLQICSALLLEKIAIMSASGVIEASYNTNQPIVNIDISALPSGIHFVYCTNASGQTCIEKLIKY